MNRSNLANILGALEHIRFLQRQAADPGEELPALDFSEFSNPAVGELDLLHAPWDVRRTANALHSMNEREVKQFCRWLAGECKEHGELLLQLAKLLEAWE